MGEAVHRPHGPTLRTSDLIYAGLMHTVGCFKALRSVLLRWYFVRAVPCISIVIIVAAQTFSERLRRQLVESTRSSMIRSAFGLEELNCVCNDALSNMRLNLMEIWREVLRTQGTHRSFAGCPQYPASSLILILECSFGAKCDERVCGHRS